MPRHTTQCIYVTWGILSIYKYIHAQARNEVLGKIMERQDCRPAKDSQSEVFGWDMSITEIPGAWILKNDPVFFLNRFHLAIDRGEAAMAFDPC